MRFSKKVVIGTLLLAFVFAQEILYVFVKTGGMEPAVLVGSFYGGVVAELFALARLEIKRKDDQNDEGTDCSEVDEPEVLVGFGRDGDRAGADFRG